MYNPELAAHTSIWVGEAAVRNQTGTKILEEAFRSTRAAGYSRVELISDFLVPDLKDRTLALLARNKLEPTVVFVEGPLNTRKDAKTTRRKVKDLAGMKMGRGVRFVNFSPSIKSDRQPISAADLDTQAYQLNRMGEDVASAGIDLPVDHYEAEMRDNEREWKYLLTNPDLSLSRWYAQEVFGARPGSSPVDMGPHVRLYRNT